MLVCLVISNKKWAMCANLVQNDKYRLGYSNLMVCGWSRSSRGLDPIYDSFWISDRIRRLVAYIYNEVHKELGQNRCMDQHQVKYILENIFNFTGLGNDLSLLFTHLKEKRIECCAGNTFFWM